MIINSGLCSVLVTLHLVYAVCPFNFIILHFSTHFIKVFISGLFVTALCINGGLVHDMREHLIGRLLAGSEPV